jgi:histone-lysine N-methyltransferase SETMAR
MPGSELRPAIRTERGGSLSQGVVLLHDNARPHTAAHTTNTLQQLNWELLEHPAHSPDLAPSGFHLFGPLKNALRGRRFADKDFLKNKMRKFFEVPSYIFFKI